ncbi:hypothetical protein PMZ80_009811 [Knufia obscura]|uniref:Glutathione S-transferase n=2 Tax=Knufia TaxID=430999 RepID=A0AAN8F3L1_9EURO|nr:hypothetical protein PMZ80_009811 [Knufia obscura]KAK5955903.1 hypothetical protein OHC33_002476 [Knufia fluminis]
MLILHHLGISQSERIVWLLEELELPYELVVHTRSPVTSPESLKSQPGNATGKAPFFEDTDENLTLNESGAICDYINYKYGGGRLAPSPSDKNYSEYLRFFHFANGTLQASMSMNMFLDLLNPPEGHPMKEAATSRLHMAFQILNDRLSTNKYLAGETLTAADIMTLYSTSTQRYWGAQINLKDYEHVLRWMKDCSERPAYQRAMEKGDPEMKPLLGAEAPDKSMVAAGGTQSSHWKKSSL